jgi:hypothetical protein
MQFFHETMMVFILDQRRLFMQVGIHATVIPLGREISAARSAGTCGVRQYCATSEKQQYVRRCFFFVMRSFAV